MPLLFFIHLPELITNQYFSSMPHKVIDVQDVVIRFSGDSGDGMQLTGSLFADTAAVFGNDITTFPDFPSEIRAPQGTLSGVSGFQVHIGSSAIYCLLYTSPSPRDS